MLRPFVFCAVFAPLHGATLDEINAQEDGFAAFSSLPYHDDDKPLTAARVAALHPLMDESGDGVVNMSELWGYYKRWRVESTQRQAQGIVNAADANKDGVVSVEEALPPLKDLKRDAGEARSLLKEELAKVQRADVNGDGVLSINEIPAYFFPDTMHSASRIRAVMREKDQNSDRRLSPQEFRDGSPHWADDRQKADFARLDLNRDGVLSFREFEPHENGDLSVERVFHVFMGKADKDGNGALSLAELTGAEDAVVGTPMYHHLSAWADHIEL